MALQTGQQVTLLRVDEMLAMKSRFALSVREVLELESFGDEGRKRRVAVVRQKGRRKDFYLDLGRDDILLDGWDVPFKTDTESGGVMDGNACYNLVGEPESIRGWIEGKSVFPVTTDAKAK